MQPRRAHCPLCKKAKEGCNHVCPLSFWCLPARPYIVDVVHCPLCKKAKEGCNHVCPLSSVQKGERRMQPRLPIVLCAKRRRKDATTSAHCPLCKKAKEGCNHVCPLSSVQKGCKEGCNHVGPMYFTMLWHLPTNIHT